MTTRIIAGANIATILMMLAVGYSDRLYPADHPTLACLGMVLPAFMLANFAFIVVWAIFKKSMLWIPILGYVVCYYPITTYMPINLSDGREEATLKVLSYNVNAFNSKDKTIEDQFPVIDYIGATEADIICLQESMTNWTIDQKLKEKMQKYEYCDTMVVLREGSQNRNILTIYSHFPIIHKEKIPYYSQNGAAGSMLARIVIDKDTVSVINNHLENCHLSQENRNSYRTLIHGNMGRDTVREESRELLSLLAESADIRCSQVDAVSTIIEREKSFGYPVILCGDFNDTPISYTNHTFSKQLSNCFVDGGLGLGLSYCRKGFYVRIDNIMCSDDFQTLDCEVDKSCTDSDHYPIIAWLKRK